MRHSFVRAAGTTALLALLAVSVDAQGALAGNGWYTTASLQNLGTTAANVSVAVYPQQGTAGAASTGSTSLAGQSQVVFFPGSGGAGGALDVSPALPSGFFGSMVVQASQPLAAIGTVTNFPVPSYNVGTPGGTASAQFRANTPSTIITYPIIKHNFNNKTTVMAIQAAPNNTSNYAAVIRTNDGVTHSKSGTLGPNHAVLLDPGQFSPPIPSTNCGDLATSPCVGGLKVSSSDSQNTTDMFTGSVIEYNTTQSPALVTQSASMFSRDDESDLLACPVFKNEYTANKRSSALSIRNSNTISVVVTARFTVVGGPTAVGETFTQDNIVIDAGSTVTLIDSLGNIGGLPKGSLASVVLYTGRPTLVAVVNETNLLAPQNQQKSATYTCFEPTSATPTISAPAVKKNYNNVTSGVTVQNVGSEIPATVTGSYACNTGTYTVGPVVIAAGASTTFYNPSNIPDGSLCAALYDGGNDTRIVGIINEAATTALDNKNYEAFNIIPKDCSQTCSTLVDSIFR